MKPTNQFISDVRTIISTTRTVAVRSVDFQRVIEVFADDIIYVYQDEDIIRFLSSSRAKEPFYVLGEGSNILFTNDFDGIILKIETKGIQIVSKTDNKITK